MNLIKPMKNRLKTGMLVLTASLAALTTAPRSSHAGIVVLTTFSGGALIGVGILAADGYVVYRLFRKEGEEPNSSQFHWMSGDQKFMSAVFVLAYLALDADGTLAQEQLQATLQKKYRFIENPEVFRNLSQIIKDKAGRISATEDRKFVSISRQELEEAVRSEDLTGFEVEFEKMAKELE